MVEALNIRHEIRAVSLDISRAFETVWHPSLLSKLPMESKANSTLGLLTSSTLVVNVWLSAESFYLHYLSKLKCSKAVLDSGLFLIFINDLFDDLSWANHISELASKVNC